MKRSLSGAVSNSELDEIYNRAQGAGALGGKVIGAGGGGFMLLFVPPEHQNDVRKRLSGLLQVPFRFESKGSEIIFRAPDEDYSAADSARKKRVTVSPGECTTNKAVEQ